MIKSDGTLMRVEFYIMVSTSISRLVFGCHCTHYCNVKVTQTYCNTLLYTECSEQHYQRLIFNGLTYTLVCSHFQENNLL